MGLINSDNFKHITFGTYFYCLFQLVSTSSIYFMLKSQLTGILLSVQ